LPPGEPYRCRATRRGGARPGFHNLETEDKILPHIASALKSLDRGEIPGQKKQKKKLDIDKFKEIIKGTEVPTMKVFIYPTNSLILSDLVERFGHEPLAIMQEIGKKVRTQGLDSPPMNITPEDPNSVKICRCGSGRQEYGGGCRLWILFFQKRTQQS